MEKIICGGERRNEGASKKAGQTTLMLPAKDKELVQIVDAALVDASARAQREDGSSWLACRPGCTPCCHGVFKISMLDAARLRDALRELEVTDPTRAHAVQRRAEDFAHEMRPLFPGDKATGLLNDDEEAWDEFANLPQIDVPCPALDPELGRCELYEARPLTCRIFGPPVKSKQGIGLCELCYVDADEPTILAGQMFLTHGPLEVQLDQQMPAGETVIAWALASREPV